MTPNNDLSKVVRTTDAGEFPAVVLIDNCSACNLACSMCDHKNIKNYRNIQLMERGLYDKIIDEISKERPDARVWNIFFGDPFLCKDMPDRVRYAKKDRGLLDVVLNTNGVLMTRERALPLIEAGLDAIYVGVDAATKITYDQIRVRGDYEAVVANVLEYRDLLRKHGHPSQKIFVQFVVSGINEHEADTFRDFWVKEGVGVKIRPKVSWAGLIQADNLEASANDARKPCFWLMQTMNICADGEVALCSADAHCRVKCGNVTKRSLKEVWQDQLKRYRTMHSEGRFSELPKMCAECLDWQSAYSVYS